MEVSRAGFIIPKLQMKFKAQECDAHRKLVAMGQGGPQKEPRAQTSNSAVHAAFMFHHQRVSYLGCQTQTSGILEAVDTYSQEPFSLYLE